MKEKIEFDQKTRANVAELSRFINSLQLQLRTICQTVLNIHGKDPELYTLAPDLSGLVKLEGEKNEANSTPTEGSS